MTLTIGIVAGEPSGDILASGLMKELHALHSGIHFIGIGGPKMLAQGLECLFSMDDITMMGLEEGFSKIRSILKIRRSVCETLSVRQLDAFVGVDVPDFNLTVELKLRQLDVPTIHYVSPTVWAWRGYRMKKIKRAVGRMLTLFPFEQPYYEQQHITATFVGHPAANLADQRLSDTRLKDARFSLADTDETLIGLLPGSRRAEVHKLIRPMLEAARLIYIKSPQTCFVLPVAKPELKTFIQAECDLFPELNLSLLDGESNRVLHASDLTIVASGTAALEALLHITPMVVVYKVTWMTALLVKLFGHVEYFSLPNHLLPEPVVPELIQDKVTAEAIAAEIGHYMDSPKEVANLKEQFLKVAKTLKQDSNKRAAEAILAEINAV